MDKKSIPSDELYRKYVEVALEALRPFQSKQTKFIYKEAPYQALCFYENILFALLLFRRKRHDEMIEGKKLLRKLLGFQNKEISSPDYGSFPADLAEFPLCNDRNLGHKVSYILEIILRDFSSILGVELLSLVQSAKELLQQQAKPALSRIEGIYWELLHGGKDLSIIPEELFGNPIFFGYILAALDYFSDCEGREKLFKKAFLFWDKEAGVYRGPACSLFHLGKDQGCMLFDCWMSLHTGICLQRAWFRETFLELALISPSCLGTMRISDEGCEEGSGYSIFSHPQGTFSASFLPVKPHLLRGFSPLRFVSGGVGVAWKIPNGKILSFTEQAGEFRAVVQKTEGKSPVWFEIFVERIPLVSFSIEGTKASFFNPFEGITIHVGNTLLTISLDPCEAELVGMLGMGNRPGQLWERQGEEEAFDWVLSYEQIRGKVVEQFSFSVTISNR